MSGDDEISHACEETQARRRYLNGEASRLESRRRGLDMAREDLDERLRRLNLKRGCTSLKMLDDGF